MLAILFRSLQLLGHVFYVGQKERHLQRVVFFPLVAFNSWKEETTGGSILFRFTKMYDLVSQVF